MNQRKEEAKIILKQLGKEENNDVEKERADFFLCVYLYRMMQANSHTLKVLKEDTKAHSVSYLLG